MAYPLSEPAPSRYTAGAIVLHWSIALLIIVQIPLGWWMVELAPRGSALQFDAYQIHKSFGVLVLVLSVARLLWRLFNPPPPLPDAMGPAERAGARAVHVLFYALILLIPLSGWALVSFSKVQVDTVLFFIPALQWPHLSLGLSGPALETAHDVAMVSHAWLAYGAGVLVIVHVAAALKHQFAGDDVIGRMRPAGRGEVVLPRRARGRIATVAVTVAAFVGAIAWGTEQSAEANRADGDVAVAAAPATVAANGTAGPAPAAGDGPPATVRVDAGGADAPAAGSAATPGTNDGATAPTPAGVTQAAGGGGGTDAGAPAPADGPAVSDTPPPGDTAAEPAAATANTAASDTAGPAEPNLATPLADDLPPVGPLPREAVLTPWTVDAGKSSITFTFPFGGNRIDGVVAGWNADIAFDPEHLAVSSISVVMRMDSASVSGGDITENQLKGADGFATAEFGAAEFSATDITETGEGEYRADGTLTIRGVSHDVSLPFTLTIENGVGRAQGTAKVNRLDYGIGQSNDPSGDWIPKAIDVSIDIVAEAPPGLSGD